MLNNLLTLIQQFLEVFIWWTVIQPWEQGLRVRLGKAPRLLAPGFHWRIPYADAIYRQAIRRRYSLFGPQTLTTLDGQTLTLSGAIGYSIRDIFELYNRLQHAEDAISSLAMGEIADFVSTRPFQECTPDAIAKHAQDALALRKFGILVHHVVLTTYARVRTYRLITDPQQTGMWGDALNTNKKDGPPSD